MDQNELNEVVRLHALYLASDGAEGERANLRWADLSDADLSDADLAGANLRGACLRGANLTDEHRT
ncbi:MAG: pentapeptide repeat-containing protein [Nitrospirota bacterium]|nr:pentapeptide repeat-containing protein [Nitrospirota bacterium]